MARQASGDHPEATKREAARPSMRETAFRSHLTTYLVTGLFLLSLNLLTSPGDLWFYWPLFFWGWALIVHAVATYGADAPVRAAAALRSIVQGLMDALPGPSGETKRVSRSAPFAATAFASVHERIERLKEISGQIPEDRIRDQALRICTAAERIAETMAADRIDGRTVTWFNDRLLEPTESLLDGYVRLSGRGIAGADETLRRVEEQNLPLIESRLDALYDQLHRGEVIDLAVASEMLELELLEAPPTSLRARS